MSAEQPNNSLGPILAPLLADRTRLTHVVAAAALVVGVLMPWISVIIVKISGSDLDHGGPFWASLANLAVVLFASKFAYVWLYRVLAVCLPAYIGFDALRIIFLTLTDKPEDNEFFDFAVALQPGVFLSAAAAGTCVAVPVLVAVRERRQSRALAAPVGLDTVASPATPSSTQPAAQAELPPAAEVSSVVADPTPEPVVPASWFVSAPIESAQLAEPVPPVAARKLNPLVPVGAAVLALLVAGGVAFGVAGKDDTAEAHDRGAEAARGSQPAAQQSVQQSPDANTGGRSSASYAGADYVGVQDAFATCVAPPSQDNSGNVIAYTPDNLVDGDPSTAWRCAGEATGVQIRLTYPQPVRVEAVGMTPGYAKLDPVNGEDRYAQNRRVSLARWTFDDGSSVTQRLDVSPTTRSLQTMDVPPTTTGSVVLTILGTSGFDSRDFTAISELGVYGR